MKNMAVVILILLVILLPGPVWAGHGTVNVQVCTSAGVDPEAVRLYASVVTALQILHVPVVERPDIGGLICRSSFGGPWPDPFWLPKLFEQGQLGDLRHIVVFRRHGNFFLGHIYSVGLGVYCTQPYYHPSQVISHCR